MHAAKFQALLDQGIVSLGAVLELFDELVAIEPAFMFGEWEGGLVPTGHSGEGQLSALRWAGKIFRGQDDVDPIVVLDEQGRRQVSPMMGKASLRVVRYRGVSTATMIYDKHPIFDHFRAVDEDLVLGVMDRKGDPAPLCFYLRRLGAAPA